MTAYNALMLAGFGLGTALFVHACWRVHLPLARVTLFALATALSGLVAGRAYVLVEQRQFTWAALADGSFRLPGVIVGLLFGLWLWRGLLLPGVGLAQLADLGAPAASFGQAFARLACLVTGCCFGTISHVPWAIRFPLGSLAANVQSSLDLLPPGATSSEPVHPLQIYFLLMHLAVGWFLLRLQRVKAYDGQVVLVGLLLSQAGKAWLESFRQPIPGVPMGHLQLASLALACLSAAVLVVVRIRRTPRAQLATT